MKKKSVIVLGSIILMLLFVVVFVSKKDNVIFKSDGVTYALTLNGSKTSSFPAKGLYKVTTSCTNGTGKWDYQNWKLYIENATGNVSCDISFNTISKTYLNNKIIGLSGTTQGTGQVVNEKGYRYEGKNPNNWVWFNNELWRIIGVFDSDTHGVSGTNLVKIIRANPIGGLAWNKSNTNDWSNSSLYNLLNNTYYNKQNGNGGEYCYVNSTSVPGNCDYSNIGIDAAYRGMIKQVTWKLGGHTATSATVATFYTAERGNATGNSNGYSATKSGYIGLMYPSDYGYSVLSSSCARTTNIGSYNTSACAGQSWLAGHGDELTLSHYSSDSSFIFILSSNGGLTGSPAIVGYVVRPSLYLEASVYVIDGTGTEADPYIIGM